MIFKNISCLDYLKEKPNESYDLVLTDPPYGIDYVNNRRNKSGKIITENGILNDGKNNGNFIIGYSIIQKNTYLLKIGYSSS